MKKFFKGTILFFLVLTLIFSLVGCSGGISGDDAKTHINSFLDAIEKSDYEEATTYLHPERPTDLKAFFEFIEKEEDLDFSSIEITKYTGFSSSYYDSTVGGSTYTQSMKVDVGGKEAEMEIEIVKNDNGYGIYNLDIDN